MIEVTGEVLSEIALHSIMRRLEMMVVNCIVCGCDPVLAKRNYIIFRTAKLEVDLVFCKSCVAWFMRSKSGGVCQVGYASDIKEARRARANISVNSIVDYHSVIGEEITSRGHTVIAIDRAPNDYGYDVAWISDKSGCVALSALSLSSVCGGANCTSSHK